MRSRCHHSLTSRALLSACGAAALVLMSVATGDGADGRAVTHLRFDQSVGLPGVELPAGAYTFEALRPDLVRVSTRDGLRVVYTGFTYPVRRPRSLGDDGLVSFAEARRGEPRPITRWYPASRGVGHQFIWR